jgi:hypothetical protein
MDSSKVLAEEKGKKCLQISHDNLPNILVHASEDPKRLIMAERGIRNGMQHEL